MSGISNDNKFKNVVLIISSNSKQYSPLETSQNVDEMVSPV